MGRTANLLMSTWVWLPPGLTWTATVELIYLQKMKHSDLSWLHHCIQESCLWLCGWRCPGETTDWPGIPSITRVSTSSGWWLVVVTALLTNSLHHPECPPIPSGSLTLHFSTSKTFLLVSWPRTSTPTPTPTSSYSQMGTFSGFLPSSTVFCARGSPTATGPGELRCATSALAPGPTTPPTTSYSSMKTW